MFHSSTSNTYHHNSSWTIRQARNYLCWISAKGRYLAPFVGNGTKVKIPSEIKLPLMAPFALYPAYPPAFWLPHKGWIKLACGPSLNTQSCNRRTLCSTFRFENLSISPKKMFFQLFQIFSKEKNNIKAILCKFSMLLLTYSYFFYY